MTILERNPKVTPLDSVLAGDVEYSISDSSLILHRLNKKPVVVLGAIFQHSPLVLLTRTEDQLISPFELKGKKVMRQYNVDDAPLTAMFHALGIPEEDIEQIPHSFNDNDFFTGKVDAISAYSSNQPFTAKQLGIEVTAISPINYGIDFYGDMLFTSEREIEKNPERAMRFLNASIKGWHYALENKAEIASLIKNKYSSKKTLEHLLFEADVLDTMIIPDLIELGHLNIERFDRIAKIYRLEGLAPPDSTLTGLSYEEHVELSKQLPRWVTWIFSVSIVASLAIIALILINRKLNRTIHLRTQALQESHKRLEHYLTIIDQQVITFSFDQNGIIQEVSDAFCSASNYSREELIGQAYNIIQHPDAEKEEIVDLMDSIHAQGFWRGEGMKITKDGFIFWLDSNIQSNQENKNLLYTAICTDVTDKKRIEQLSITDKLTKIYNRLKLDYSLTHEMYRSDRTLEPLSILLIDIDHFKAINDIHGHLVGDLALVDIAETLTTSVRELDIVGRWGGEEFLVICPNTNITGAQKLANKLLTSISSNLKIDNQSITASIGVGTHQSGENNDSFVKRADDALYLAKRNGRNRVELEKTDKSHQSSVTNNELSPPTSFTKH